VLEVRGLHKVYDSHGRRVEAIGDLTFTVPDGRFVCVVGPSGCGKTTLLRCIAGLLPPTAGEVWVEGNRVAGPPPGLAVVFQEYGRSLFPWLRVRDNVELPLWACTTCTGPTRGSCPAGCSSGSRSPGRSPTNRGCC
jgi:NitT/TauT family transport system ATP-binding protein